MVNRAEITEALMAAQKTRGWVSDQAIADIAQALGMSREEVDAVATYMELVFRSPVGRHVVMVCDSVSCEVTGYREVLARLSSALGIELGQTTSDGSFTLLPVACLGVCEQAPAMMVDGEVFGNLTPESAEEILVRYRARPGATSGASKDGSAS